MMADEPDLLDQVANKLQQDGISFALIGAAALAVHGISRSTLDLDLLATDRHLLDERFWTRLPGVTVEIRRGDELDPLAGVVRCRAAEDRVVDVVIGKTAWQAEIIARAEPARRHGRNLPTARVDDLILLKLYAGGSQDRWDIEQLLARPDREAIVSNVDARVSNLPATSRQMWTRLKAGPDA